MAEKCLRRGGETEKWELTDLMILVDVNDAIAICYSDVI
jgi:hypothetical protein